MRIIDKNKDYYDYLQCYTDDIVYDRRNSHFITLDDLEKIWMFDIDERFLLLQVGYSNWLIKIIPTKYEEKNGWTYIQDYSVELLEYWKDYNHCNKLTFGVINKRCSFEYLFSKKFQRYEKLSDDVKHGNYEFKILYTEKHENILFSKSKIPSIVKPFDLYNAFDEYFSHLKDDVNYDNMTDKEKIESHGFDKKTSFRNIK